MTNRTEYELALYGVMPTEVKHLCIEKHIYPILSVMFGRTANTTLDTDYNDFWEYHDE